MKVALFVDFDNVYSGLRRISVEAAERFSRYPLNWLRWIAEGNASSQTSEQAANRRVLVRRCYLNPVVYQKYRRPFHEAGFEIVDCPPMTATGKTSTDIHLVLDTMDALADGTHFDEFIIFSADADFSPVLRRLRRHDRRTVVFAAGAMSESYKASADKVVDIQDFLRNALQIEDDRNEDTVWSHTQPPVTAFPNLDFRTRVADCIHRIVLQAGAPVALPAIAQHLQKEFPSIRDRQWDGAGSFGALLKDLTIPGVGFNFQQELAIDLRRQERMLASTAAQEPVGTASDQSSTSPKTLTGVESLNAKAAVAIKNIVAKSDEGVLFSTIGEVLRKEVPELGNGWPGASTLGAFLKQLQLLPLKKGVLSDGSTFVIYDPSRHDLPAPALSDRLVASMLRAAELPAMTGSEFRLILNETIPHTGLERPFEISEVSRSISEALTKSGTPATPRRLASVLQALIFGGLDTSQKYEDQEKMLVDALGVVLSAWTRETQIQADDDARNRLIAWLET